MRLANQLLETPPKIIKPLPQTCLGSVSSYWSSAQSTWRLLLQFHCSPSIVWIEWPSCAGWMGSNWLWAREADKRIFFHTTTSSHWESESPWTIGWSVDWLQTPRSLYIPHWFITMHAYQLVGWEWGRCCWVFIITNPISCDICLAFEDQLYLLDWLVEW